MKVISVASQKGGAGKSTLVANLAPFAAQSNRVLVADLDPQANLERWYQRREADNLRLVTATPADIGGIVERASSQFDWLFIDTVGKADPSGSAAIAVADFVLIPAQPSTFDLEAATTTMQQVKAANKPFAFVVTRTRATGSRGTTAANALAALGPVATPAVVERVIYQDAAGVGMAAFELDPNHKAAGETAALFKWINGAMDKMSFTV